MQLNLTTTNPQDEPLALKYARNSIESELKILVSDPKIDDPQFITSFFNDLIKAHSHSGIEMAAQAGVKGQKDTIDAGLKPTIDATFNNLGLSVKTSAIVI